MMGTEVAPQYLYLILDDWEYGYSFREVDLSSDESGWHQPGRVVIGDIMRETASYLPCSFFHLPAQRGKPWHFSAIGSKILAMPPRGEQDGLDPGSGCLDVLTRAVTYVPRHTDEHRPIYFHIGNRLFMLGMSSFQYLDLLKGNQQLPWCDLPKPPFDSYCATAHAVHPHKRTIFVSVGLLFPNATFSFHMTEDGRSSAWKHFGDWILPFQGQAYFDHKLNTWIGLSMHGDERGHIFSCDLEPAITGRRPDVKYAHEYLFSSNPNEAHRGATLVCMGHESKYCLVECVSICYLKRADQEAYFRHMFRLTTFFLGYNETGDLTTGHLRVRYYFAPKDVTSFACQLPVVFSM
ncbi:unnamed protein product [Urochloa decumbens]|uniref:Uncharacterized protein n=1 Tax=Urochloa decumbens TaxID=240449 RepID=A0ABC8XKQ7_9POAL